MKDINGTLQHKGKEYPLVFNLNVMEQIQAQYGSVDAWAALTDGSQRTEPDAKAVIFGFTCMLNEGIDIRNEETGATEPMMTTKQVGRLLSEYGLAAATAAMNKTVVDSIQTEEKNA